MILRNLHTKPTKLLALFSTCITVLTAGTVIVPQLPETISQNVQAGSLGEYSALPCNRTLNPGEKIQPAIDAVRGTGNSIHSSDPTAVYVLCLNPGLYLSGMNGQVVNETNHDYGNYVDPSGDWRKSDDGPYFGNITIRNKKGFVLRGLQKDGKKAVILAHKNNESYASISNNIVDPLAHAPNDISHVLQVVNSTKISIEGLEIDGFYYPNPLDRSKKESQLNRLIWFQNTTESRIFNNVVKNAGGECIRLMGNSQYNIVNNNVVKGCGFYQYLIQPLKRLQKNGEAIYLGTDPYQIRVNQIYRWNWWGLKRELFTDRTSFNIISNNDLEPGSMDDLQSPPLNSNKIRDGLNYQSGYGNECVDIKEDFEDKPGLTFSQDFEKTIRETNTKEASSDKLTEEQIKAAIAEDLKRGKPGNNLVTDNKCKTTYDEESGAFNSRGPNNKFEYNSVTGVIRGPAFRFGGGQRKPVVANPKRSDPVKGGAENDPGTIIWEKKWQATNNVMRKNIVGGWFNDPKFDYEKGDCPADGGSCSRLNTKYVVKTFAESGEVPESQATGEGVCGNVNKDGIMPPDTNWGKNYLGAIQTFARVPSLAKNIACTGSDKDVPAGPRTVINQPYPTKQPIYTPTPNTSCPNRKVGDVNCDNLIDLVDFSVFREEYIAFRQSSGFDITQALSDFNKDQSIDLSDFELFRSAYIAQRTSTPIPTTTSVAPSTTPSIPTGNTFPAQILDLTKWKMQLPTGSQMAHTDIFQPQLATYKNDPFFMISDDGKGIRFRASVNAGTTSGSSYPRSELREMTDSTNKINAAWSSSSGTHTMYLDQAITAVPKIKKHVVAGQIHDSGDDVIVIRLEGTKLFVDINGADGPVLDANYTLGKRFQVKFVASGGQTKIYYNNSTIPSYTLSKSYSGAYFKAGAYTQSNCSTEGSANCATTNYGEVVVYDVKVTHQ